MRLRTNRKRTTKRTAALSHADLVWLAATWTDALVRCALMRTTKRTLKKTLKKTLKNALRKKTKRTKRSYNVGDVVYLPGIY